ncbi:hypothetical protein [uncultured Enterovirga sp.]|uniref:hypothetical protein n=1 Tax=uncultured Enterovirga sp. TaxID=2026352 RepID=UPI0035CC3186
MVVVLILLALSLVGVGGAAVVFGAPIIQIERGYTMVLAGTMAVCSGILLLGVALAAQRLGRAAQELVRIRDRLQRMEMSTASSGVTAMPANGPLPAFSPSPGANAGYGSPAEPNVVGQYSSGGNAYVMYSDGTILADTPSGKHRFRSLDELRAFTSGGGERANA